MDKTWKFDKNNLGAILRKALERDSALTSDELRGIKGLIVAECFPIKERYWIDKCNLCSQCNKYIAMSNDADKEYRDKPHPGLVSARCHECIVNKCTAIKCQTECMFYLSRCYNH